MPKLVVIEGITGSGKSTISKYVESLGFDRYCTDEVMKEEIAIPLGLMPRAIFRSLPHRSDTTEFWDYFWCSRGDLGYNLDSARNVLSSHKYDMENGRYQVLSREERFHVGYALWDHFLSLRDGSIKSGEDVVLDPIIGNEIRKALLKTDYLDIKVQKYIIHLHVNPDIAVERKMTQMGWAKKVAEGRIKGRKLDFRLPETHDFVFKEYENNTDKQLGEIKEDLVSVLFGSIPRLMK